MERYLIETHILGTAVKRPKFYYHLIDQVTNKILYISKQLKEIYWFCHTNQMSNNNIHLLLNENDKKIWYQINKLNYE